jgi:hypothetical protein
MPTMAATRRSIPTLTDTPMAIFVPSASPLEGLLNDAKANVVYAPEGNC